MKEIARYIYISSFPFLLLPSSRDDHLEFHFSIRSPRVHNLHTAIISLTKPSIPYLSFILFQKKKKKKKKRKKNSRNEISEAEINFRITAEFETRSADHKCARDARKKIVNVFHHPSSSHAWFLRLDRARMLGHTRTTGREKEREISLSLRHGDEGTGGERSPAGRSTFRSRSCETCSPPRWAPPSPSQDRGGPRSRCSPLPPTLSCGRSSTGHPCLRGPVNRPPPRNRPAACDPSSSVCSSASTVHHRIFNISFFPLFALYFSRERERERKR